MPAIQQAVYGALTGDAQLTALLGGDDKIVDGAPEDIAYPWIDLGEAMETPFNTHDGFGRETPITLHVWTQARGHSQGLTIAARVLQVLDHQPLTITGHHHIVTRYESGQTLTDPEPPGDIRHVVLRYRVITEQND
jgi:hypothetical protein